MNNQPKFKKGDGVRVIGGTHKGEIIRYSLEHLAYEVMCEDCFSRFWYESDLESLPSATPDMLAIPDDHVWPVEWKLLQLDTEKIWVVSDGNTSAFMTGCDASVPLKAGYTHYLTEADILKLPFQQ